MESKHSVDLKEDGRIKLNCSKLQEWEVIQSRVHWGYGDVGPSGSAVRRAEGLIMYPTLLFG